MGKDNKSMPAETTIGISSLKWLWAAVFIPVFRMLWNKVDRLEEKSYTKNEADKQIDLKLEPVKEEMKAVNKVLQENTSVLKELSSTMTDLRIDLAVIHKDNENNRRNKND